MLPTAAAEATRNLGQPGSPDGAHASGRPDRAGQPDLLVDCGGANRSSSPDKREAPSSPATPVSLRPGETDRTRVRSGPVSSLLVSLTAVCSWPWLPWSSRTEGYTSGSFALVGQPSSPEARCDRCEDGLPAIDDTPVMFAHGAGPFSRVGSRASRSSPAAAPAPFASDRKSLSAPLALTPGSRTNLTRSRLESTPGQPPRDRIGRPVSVPAADRDAGLQAGGVRHRRRGTPRQTRQGADRASSLGSTRGG